MLIEPAPYASPIDVLARMLGFDFPVWLVEPLAVLIYSSLATAFTFLAARKKIRIVFLAILLPLVALSGCATLLGFSCATGGGCV